MARRVWLALLAIGLGAGCASWPSPPTAAAAPPGYGLAVGSLRVRDADGNEVSPQAAVLVADPGGQWGAVGTDQRGRFHVALPPGRYYIASVNAPLLTPFATEKLRFVVEAGKVTYLGHVEASLQPPFLRQFRQPDGVGQLEVSVWSMFDHDRPWVEHYAAGWPIVDRTPATRP